MKFAQPIPLRTPTSSGPVVSLQRKCDCGTGGGPCTGCSTEDDTMMRSAAGPAPGGRIPESVTEALRASGSPLDSASQTFAESHFGHDFSRVRVHTDTRAAQSAREVNAHAYTVGQDIVFAAGRYAPSTGSGRQLLTHELAHVVQQSGGSSGLQAAAVEGISSPSDAAEREADEAAAAAVRGG